MITLDTLTHGCLYPNPRKFILYTSHKTESKLTEFKKKVKSQIPWDGSDSTLFAQSGRFDMIRLWAYFGRPNAACTTRSRKRMNEWNVYKIFCCRQTLYMTVLNWNSASNFFHPRLRLPKITTFVIIDVTRITFLVEKDNFTKKYKLTVWVLIDWLISCFETFETLSKSNN